MDAPEEAPEPAEPRRVTRADALPLMPMTSLPTTPGTVSQEVVARFQAREATSSAVKSFFASVFLGVATTCGLGATLGSTHTCGSQRSVEIKKEKRQAEIREALKEQLDPSSAETPVPRTATE